MMELLHKVQWEFTYGVIAILGGIARYLNGYVKGAKFKFGIFCASAFVAGFSGWMFAALGESMQFPNTMTFIMAGLGGFFGEQTLKFILELVEHKI